MIGKKFNGDKRQKERCQMSCGIKSQEQIKGAKLFLFVEIGTSVDLQYKNVSSLSTHLL